MNIPTIHALTEKYLEIAKTQAVKTGSPTVRTTENVLTGVRQVCRAAGVQLSEPITVLTRPRIDQAILALSNRGVRKISISSYVSNLRGLIARWTLAYYEDCGWDVAPLTLPFLRRHLPRYVRPSAELLRKVKVWYAGLTGAHWLAATMMLEYGMRNGDVLRLTDANFVEKTAYIDGRTVSRRYLSYRPHKTENSSCRTVLWPLHSDFWRTFSDQGGFAKLAVTQETFRDINRDLRGLGFVGTKAAYELRKICIDHIYQRWGAECAVSISGDDIRTISRYYSDPSIPNVGDLKVIEMLDD